MKNAYWKKYILNFRNPSGTSRGVLLQKVSYFIISERATFAYPAIGECSLIAGLSPDPMEGYEQTLTEVCHWINEQRTQLPDLSLFPSIRFGLETFLADAEMNGSKIFGESAFTKGDDAMLINGLVWMGKPGFMMEQVAQKVAQGYSCIKLKIGAINFKEEVELLKSIRNNYGNELELRVDANGAFQADEALSKLEILNAFNIHSIEQPIMPNQWEIMAKLCRESPIPIALDEELITVTDEATQVEILQHIKPAYIILKPSLIGGLDASNRWIEEAEKNGIGWWMTSALESNIGLNAITQFTYKKGVNLPQGLGTGSLYLNNFESPLYINGEMINFDPTQTWNLNPLLYD